MLIPDELRAVAARFPERVAIDVVDRGQLTFAAWDRRSNAVGRGLVDDVGIAPGDRVALLLANEHALAFATAYFAVQKAGAVAVPVNPRYAPREVEHVLRNCQARAVVTAGDHVALARQLEGQLDPSPVVLAEPEWDSLLAHDERELQVPIAPDQLADILYTSGTTGLPKGVAATHDNALHQRSSPIEAGGKLLHSLPLTTFTGTYGAQLMCLRFAITQLLLPSFDAARFASLIATERPGWLLMVPAHVLLLIESGALDGVDTSSVTVVLYGSAPMPPHAVQWLGETFPKAIQINGYGLTEGGGSACTLPPGEALKRPGSVGKPMAGVELRIVDEEGSEVVQGEVGEITIRIPSGRRYYFNDPEASAQTWRNGWVHTGDLGYVDDDGFLYLVDRSKDMVIRGGYNVYCIEVEDALFEHPDVVEVAVVGIPHPVLGQDIAAVVRLRDGAPELTLDAARQFVTDRLADYKRPRRLVLRDEPLPRSGAGKVDKKALLAELTSG